MNAEIISVGTELLLGQVVNLDTAIVAQELSGLGINLLYSAVVGDNVERLKHAVDTAISRSDLLIMTGGLGPTTDDLTKETTAACAGKKLVLHQPSLDRILNYFNEKKVSSNQEKQAWLPEGCTVFQNDNGTAPGCAFQAESGCTIIMLPGPPSELTPMLKNYVVPFLKKEQEYVIVSHNVHIYGRGEAPVAQMLDDLMDGENPTLAPYAKEGECYMRVTAKAHTPEEADAMCQPLIEEIKRRVGDFVYSVDVETLEELVVSLLKEQGKKLACAESCTAGFSLSVSPTCPAPPACLTWAVSPTPTRPRRTCCPFPGKLWSASGLSAPKQPGRWLKAWCAAPAATWGWASPVSPAPMAGRPKSLWGSSTLPSPTGNTHG